MQLELNVSFYPTPHSPLALSNSPCPNRHQSFPQINNTTSTFTAINYVLMFVILLLANFHSQSYQILELDGNCRTKRPAIQDTRKRRRGLPFKTGRSE